MKRVASSIAITVAAAALVAAPTAATAAPLTAETTSLCTVESAQMEWGVKESFRSYISGSIANGEWTTSDDMTYETPSFIWSESSGEVTNDLSEGSIRFTGSVQFTGHSGALQFDLADPALEFESADTAYLSIGIGATDEGDSGGVAESELVRVAKVDLEGYLETGDTQLDIDGAVPVLTSEGAEGFNGEYGSYVSGDELDPITLTASLSGCGLFAQEAAPAEEPPVEEIVPIAETEQSIPWLPIIIGAVALLVIGITGGMLIGGRKKKPAAATPAEGQEPSGAPANQHSVDKLFGDQNQ